MAKTGILSKDNALFRYFKETRAEISKVSWPTRRQAIHLTLIVAGVTLVMAVLLGILDYVFAQLIGWIVR